MAKIAISKTMRPQVVRDAGRMVLHAFLDGGALSVLLTVTDSGL
jgi:hypothetical protein